jgi:ubiquinone/menaquinone biosynthesis C-methylase UbiE
MSGSFRDAELLGWTARADSYDKLFTPLSNQVIPSITAALGNVRGKRVLDVCCGSGHLTAALISAGADAEGLDFAPTIVAKAMTNHPDIRFRQGDAESLPYEKESFDHIVCCYGVMHLERPDHAIADAYRVLRRGGRYVFTQWAKDDQLLQIVSAAIAAHGDPAVVLPPAPPMMRFGDPDECSRALNAAGFQGITVDRIDVEWRESRAEALLDLIHGSAVRAALLIDAQAPERRARIHKAIVAAARANSPSPDAALVRRPTVLAGGTKVT